MSGTAFYLLATGQPKNEFWDSGRGTAIISRLVLMTGEYWYF